MFINPKISNNKGYIALMCVLIIGAISLSIAIFLFSHSLSSSRTSFTIEQSEKAKALANACAEQALQEIRNDISFNGIGDLSLDQGTCSYNVTNLGEQNREITSIATKNNVVRKVKINIDTINPQINIVSWQEVSDF